MGPLDSRRPPPACAGVRGAQAGRVDRLLDGRAEGRVSRAPSVSRCAGRRGSGPAPSETLQHPATRRDEKDQPDVSGEADTSTGLARILSVASRWRRSCRKGMAVRLTGSTGRAMPSTSSTPTSSARTQPAPGWSTWDDHEVDNDYAAADPRRGSSGGARPPIRRTGSTCRFGRCRGRAGRPCGSTSGSRGATSSR